jgi:predicted lipid-binding transport protein (Tim44 family)
MKIWTIVLGAALTLGAIDADAARRMGGGGSFGRQSPNVTQRQSTPPAAPAAPTNAQQQRSPAAQAAPAPATQPARRPWAGMLGGLAAGLGLAWLAHSLGLGEAFGQFLLIALLVLAVMVVIGIVRSRRKHGAARPAG